MYLLLQDEIDILTLPGNYSELAKECSANDGLYEFELLRGANAGALVFKVRSSTTLYFTVDTVYGSRRM